MPFLRSIMVMVLASLLALPLAASAPTVSAVADGPHPTVEDETCQTLVFGSDAQEETVSESGVAWEAQVAETLLADSIEVTAVLAAEPPAEAHLALRHNGEVLVEWDQMVASTRWTAYRHDVIRRVDLAPGDTLRFEARAQGPPTVRLRISGPNEARFCHRGVDLPEPVFLAVVARRAAAPGAQPTIAPSSPAIE